MTRTWTRRLLFGAAVFLCILVAVYATAWATTDRFGVSRAIVWMEADTGDIDRFPSRPVAAGADVLDLPGGEPLDLEAVWPGGDAETFLTETQTAAFLVLQDGEVRYERYFNGTDAAELRTSFSAAKSFVSTLIGLAIADGAIGSVDD